jgi:hypothetical protein
MAGPWSVGLLAAAATGYRYSVVPAVLPEVVLRWRRFEAALIAQPLSLRDSPAFVAVQLRIPLRD